MKTCSTQSKCHNQYPGDNPEKQYMKPFIHIHVHIIHEEQFIFHSIVMFGISEPQTPQNYCLLLIPSGYFSFNRYQSVDNID